MSKLTKCCKKKTRGAKERGHLLEIDAGLGEKDAKCSIYISFAKQDRKFVKHVHDVLVTDNRQVKVDFQTVYDNTPDWLDEIHNLIEEQDVFVVVLSPSSIDDQMVNFETDHARKNGKRIIPVVCKDVDINKVRKDISTLAWIFFQPERFQKSMKLLMQAVDADVRHAIYHTKLLTHAIEWERADFEKSKLLVGEDLIKAKHWLSASALGKEPRPTTLHLSFITASDSLNSSMKKRGLIAVFFAFIVVIGIIWPSWGVFFFSLIFSHFFVYFASN